MRCSHHGGLSLELCAVSPYLADALFVWCVHSATRVGDGADAVWTAAACLFPGDEAQSLSTDKVYLPHLVRGRVLWHLANGERQCSGFYSVLSEFQRAAYQQEPRIRSEGYSPMA